ncbi:hypothetical protein ECNE037_2165, partial [Escherichia coli NE037]
PDGGRCLHSLRT